MSAVTEDGSGLSVRQTPRKRAYAEIKDFTMLVRVPGDPAAVRVFTDAERSTPTLTPPTPAEPWCRFRCPRPPNCHAQAVVTKMSVEGQQVGLDLWPREHDLSATLGWTTRGVGRLERHRRRD